MNTIETMKQMIITDMIKESMEKAKERDEYIIAMLKEQITFLKMLLKNWYQILKV